MMIAAAEGHGLPASVFTPLYNQLLKSAPGFMKTMGFDVQDRHLGQVWFEGLCWSTVACLILIAIAFLGTRRLERVPRGLQSFLELVVSGFRSMVASMAGPVADKYVPFIGSAFLFIFTMNLLGLVPAGRSPTMALSITGGMGLTAWLLFLFYAVRDAGPKAVAKHLAGPVWWLAPLIFGAELLSVCVRPVTLSMRLFGNIYGEDNVLEAFMGMGGWFPLHAPILLLALLTSFLQAYIFTMLCTYYISDMVVHGDDHGAEHGHEEHEHH